MNRALYLRREPLFRTFGMTVSGFALMCTTVSPAIYAQVAPQTGATPGNVTPTGGPRQQVDSADRAGISPWATDPNAVFPDTGYPANFKPIKPPVVPRPAYLQKTIDPTFKSTVYRIADKELFTPARNIIQHHYAKDQAWNCDGTLLKLTGGYLLDGNTYALKGKLPFGNQKLWSHVDPHKVFAFLGTEYFSANVITGEKTTIYNFDQFDSINVGNNEGNLSLDDRYVAIIGRLKGSADFTIAILDIADKKIVAQKPVLSLGPAADPDWVTMSQSGKYVVINWKERGKNGEVVSYDRNLNRVATLAPRGNHGDCGYDAFGNEIYAQLGGLAYYRLDTGEKTVYIKDLQSLDGHLSLRAYKRPGWAYLSTRGPFNDGVAIKMDGSGTVERLAHLHVGSASASLVPSPDGRKVMWNSDWLDDPNRFVYPYVAEVGDIIGKTKN